MANKLHLVATDGSGSLVARKPRNTFVFGFTSTGTMPWRPPADGFVIGLWTTLSGVVAVLSTDGITSAGIQAKGAPIENVIAVGTNVGPGYEIAFPVKQNDYYLLNSSGAGTVTLTFEPL